MGNFSPHEAFAIGGTNSVRGYEEGAVASGRSYVVGSGEISFPVVCGKVNCLSNFYCALRVVMVFQMKDFNGSFSICLMFISVLRMPWMSLIMFMCEFRNSKDLLNNLSTDIIHPVLQVGPVGGVVFCDYGTDLGSGQTVPGLSF